MIRVILILFAVMTALTTAASAGPWPRAEGEGFLSFSLDIDAEELDDNFVSFYLEYGLNRGRTLVIDRQESGDQIGKTFALLRFPLSRPDRQLKLAYDVGLGAVDDHVAFRTGFSIGRGWTIGSETYQGPFKWAGRWSGWWSIDSRALVFDDGINGSFETDFTFGMQVTKRVKSISQLQAGVPFRGDDYAKIAQSFVYQASDTRHYLFGVTAGVHEVDDIQVNLGLWQDF